MLKVIGFELRSCRAVLIWAAVYYLIFSLALNSAMGAMVMMTVYIYVVGTLQSGNHRGMLRMLPVTHTETVLSVYAVAFIIMAADFLIGIAAQTVSGIFYKSADFGIMAENFAAAVPASVLLTAVSMPLCLLLGYRNYMRIIMIIVWIGGGFSMMAIGEELPICAVCAVLSAAALIAAAVSVPLSVRIMKRE